MNVREKLSLCYYASSLVDLHKGLMIVSSGVDFDKFGAAKDEICAQLEAIKRGEVTADELLGRQRKALHPIFAQRSTRSIILRDFTSPILSTDLTLTPRSLPRRSNAWSFRPLSI